MRIVDNGDPELRQDRTCFGNVRSGCNSVSFLTYYSYTSDDSKHMPKLKQIPDDPKNEGLIFAIHQQTRRIEKRFLGNLKESRQNQLRMCSLL
jgi:hypothetical protein